MTEEKKNWWERATATLEDIEKTYNRGVTKGVEGVIDAGIGAVGAVGGIFSDDFKRTMQKAIQFDLTGYLTEDTRIMDWMQAVGGNPRAIKELITGDKTLEETRKDSFLTGNKVGEFMQEGVESIGHMMPGLALSLIPGAGPALSMGYTGLSAGGGAMEEALNEGAGYYNALGYGVLSGGTEALMEKLGGYAFGDATSLVGKATAGTKFGAWASKGLGKAITGAVSEGVEELGSGFADPVNKWVTGVDTDIGANFRKAYKESGKTFLMGATVGSIMQGGQVTMQTMSNKAAGRGGAKATRADSSFAYVSESAQNYGKNETQNKRTDKAILQGLTDVGVQMSDMTKEERAVYRESLGEYKNAFNEDGSIKLDLVNADVNAGAISRKLQPISATLKHAPITANEEISQGAGEAKSHIEKVLGGKANVVITNSDSGTNAFFNPDENVFYINNKSATLNDADSAIKKASLQVSFHEMTHSAEGTKQYNEFVNELYRVAMDENAPDAIKKRVGSLFGREFGARQDYAEQTKGMSKAQARYTVDTEVIADLSGDLMADDYIINKLAERNAPLVKKLISRFKGTIKKSATVDSESIKYLKKLVSKFEKALDNAQGGVKISQIGNDDEEREEKADSSQQSADSKVDDERKSVESSNDGVFQTEFENTVDAILNNTYNSENVVIIGRTPNILTDIGLSQLPLSITANHIYSIAKTEQEAIAEGRYRQNTNYHGLGAQAVKQIREKLSEPIMILAHQEFTPPQQAQHVQSKKIVVLVDLQVNGKQVICPIQVDTEVKKGNNRYDVNLIDTYFDKGNVGDLIKEAVAKENIGEIGFYYMDKKKAANLLQGPGYQLPQQLASRLTAFNTIIRKIDANVNRKISDFTQSQQFIRFFGDWQNNPAKASKVINDDGTPKVLYHQTNADFYIFDTSIEGAGARDNEMPNGIFLKSTPLDIGLKGKKQMKVYANIRNPLVFADRGEASRYWKQNIDGYKAIIDEIGNNDVKYQEKFDEAFDAVSDDDSKAEAVFEEWENANTVLDKKAKKLINEYLKNNKYDGIILENDEGSFGRKVQTFIALESTQIKSATDNIGTFDSSNPDIRYSKQRSYEPGKESEFEEKLEIAEQERQENFNQLMAEQLEEMQSLIKNRNESFEQLLSAKYDKVPVTEEFENSEAISIDEADRDRLDSFNQQMSERLKELKVFDKERRELEAQLLKRNNVPIAENLTQNEAASLESAERDRLESVKRLMNEKLEEFKAFENQRKELEAQLLGKKENIPVTEEFESSEAISLDEANRERLESFNQQMEEMLDTTQTLINGDQSSIDAIVNSKSRGYTRKTDVGKVISDTFEMYAVTDESGDTVPFLAKDAKKEIIASVWKKVNSVKHFSKKKFASLMADKILENTVLADSKIYKTEELLKGFMHKIDISSFADLIDKDIKRKITARWAVREGQESISLEQIIMKINDEFSVQISMQDPYGAIKEIDALYESTKKYIAEEAGEILKNKMGADEYKKAHDKIAEDLNTAFENMQTENELAGKLTFVIDKAQKENKKYREYRKEFKVDETRVRAINTLIHVATEVEKIKNHEYSPALQPKFEEFKGVMQKIGRLKIRGNVNQSSAREIMADLSTWYTKENAMLEGIYDEDMAKIPLYFKGLEATEKELSLSEIRQMTAFLTHVKNIFQNWGKIYRGGQWVEITDVAQKQFEVASKAAKNATYQGKILVGNNVYLATPEVVAKHYDGHDKEGENTRLVEDLKHGELMREWEFTRLCKEFDKFIENKENKKYFKRFFNGKETVTCGMKVDIESLTITPVEIPLTVFGSLYLTVKAGNEDAIATIEEVGGAIRFDNDKKYTYLHATPVEQIMQAYEKLPEPVKKILEFIERWHNTTGRQIKYDQDLSTKGRSNLIKGKYYPEFRLHYESLNDIERMFHSKALGNHSFNKERIKHSRSPLIFDNCIERFFNHAYELYTYKYIDTIATNYNKVMQANISSEGERARSVKMLMEQKTFFTGKRTSAGNYFDQLIKDINGKSTRDDVFNRVAGMVRGATATALLGANPKVLLTQASSNIAVLGEIGVKSWLGIWLNPVNFVKAVAYKIKGTVSDAQKYSKWAEARAYSQGAIKAATISDKVNVFSNFFMKGIEIADALNVDTQFKALVKEVERKFGLKAGTEENKIKAGELLDEIGMRTQQNQYASTRPAITRSENELAKGFAMFKTDSMMFLSNFFSNLEAWSVLNKQIKAAQESGNDALVKELTKQRNEAIRKSAKYTASLILMCAYMALLGRLFRKLYKQDEDDEATFTDFAVDMFMSFAGMMPIVSELASYFIDGFEVDNLFYSSFNNMLSAVKKTFSAFGDLMHGKEVTSQEWATLIRNDVYTLGQMFGVPTKNIWKNTQAIVGICSKSADLSIDAIFKEQSDTDLKESYKEAKAKGNVSLAGKSLDLIYKNHDMELSDTVLKKELDRLNGLDITKKDDDKSNYSVIAKRAPDTITFEGEEVELTAKQKNAFKTAYKTAEADAGKMVRVYKYKKLDSASQAYAIRKIYEYHYSKSEEGITGERERLVYFGDIIGIDKLALIIGYANSLKGDKNRKEKITAYIKSMGLISQHASLALRYLGYADKENDSKVKNFINARSSLTREQKAEFLKMLKLN